MIGLGALIAQGCAPPGYRVVYQPMTVRVRPVPVAKPMPKQIEISERIQFETNKATLLSTSHGVLDQVVTVMKDTPRITMVEIQGHTDSSGDPAKNDALSQQRAESVRAYLMEKGIEGGRLTAKGYGSQKGVADNGTPEGRQTNRRVEFHIIQQGGAQ